MLTVHISLTLTGDDYSHATFAGSDDGNGGTLITINAVTMRDIHRGRGDADCELLRACEHDQRHTTLDPSPAATGSIDFTDIDLTDRPTATITTRTRLARRRSIPRRSTLTPDEIPRWKTRCRCSRPARTTARSAGAIRSPTARWISSGRARPRRWSPPSRSTTSRQDRHGPGHGHDHRRQRRAGDHDRDERHRQRHPDRDQYGAEPDRHADRVRRRRHRSRHASRSITSISTSTVCSRPNGLASRQTRTLLNYLSVQSGDILNGTATHAQFSWDFNSGESGLRLPCRRPVRSRCNTPSCPTTVTRPARPTSSPSTSPAATMRRRSTARRWPPSPATTAIRPETPSAISSRTSSTTSTTARASRLSRSALDNACDRTEGVWQYEIAGTRSVG